MSIAKRPPRSSSDTIRAHEKRKSGEQKSISVAEFFASEDADAMSLEWQKTEETFAEYSNDIRQLCGQLSLENTSEEMISVGESLLSRLISMRRLNRLAQYKNRRARDVANEERAVVDERFLQLQNVQSEIEHLQKEISRCLEFRSADEDIEFVPLNEFFANADEELKKAAKESAHHERIARLQWELIERKSLVGTLQEREGRKNVLISDISTKEHRLKSLKPMIESLIEASRPVQELMGLNTLSSSSMEQRQLVARLPKELFLIYIQVEAYIDIAKDKDVRVRCEGDLENAMKFTECERQSESGAEDEGESTDADIERGGSPSRLRRRPNTLDEEITKKKEALIAPHPIYLVLEITCADGITLSVQLQYIQELHAIGALAKLRGSSLPFCGNILCNESILMELYPGDTGEKCPNTVGQVKLDQYHITVSEYERKVGRMYAFSQRMAGLYEEAVGGSQLCEVIQSVIETLRARIRSRSTLIKSIQSLRSLKIFKEMTPKERREYPAKILSELTEFKVISAEEFLSNVLLTNDYRELINAEHGDHVNDQFYFHATVERGSAKLIALIYIGVGYPLHNTPLFILGLSVAGKEYNSKSSLLLQNLEMEINVSLVENTDVENSDRLLSTQMAFLISRCDVLLEVNSALTNSSDFSREHLFSRLTRGRDQQPPLNFDALSNAFNFSFLN